MTAIMQKSGSKRRRVLERETPAALPVTWSQRMARAKSLRAKGAGYLYERVQELCLIYEDSGFRDDCTRLKENPEDVLDREVGDTCTNFLMLRCVMEHFPHREAWEGERLDLLVARVEEKLNTEKARRVARVDRPEWKKKYEELEKKYERLLGEYGSLQTSYNSLLARINSPNPQFAGAGHP